MLAFDKPHNLVTSFNSMLPEPAWSRAWLRAITGGWHESGIGTFISGPPIVLNFSGDLATLGVSQAWFGTPAITVGEACPEWRPCTCVTRGSPARSIGEKFLDIDAIAIPAFGEDGPPQPPYDLRTPWRTNLDLTVFTNIRGIETRCCSSGSACSAC